jgi:hypothetical protein
VGGFVKDNSIAISDTGFDDVTSNLFINTGIHSPKKKPTEPFKYAGDNPVKNHNIDLQDMASSATLLSPITTYDQTTKTRTFNALPIIEQVIQKLTIS